MNFGAGIVDSFRQARKVVTVSLQVFVTCGTVGKCGLQSKFGTQKSSLDCATPVASRTKHCAVARRRAADDRSVARSHIGVGHRRYAHLSQRSVPESAARVSDSIAADILRDCPGGGNPWVRTGSGGAKRLGVDQPRMFL